MLSCQINILLLSAHFHLRNGAVMWRLNWQADTSPRGIGASCGIMVNYRYFLDEAEANSGEYMEKHNISASSQFLELITDLPKHGEAKGSWWRIPRVDREQGWSHWQF